MEESKSPETPKQTEKKKEEEFDPDLQPETAEISDNYYKIVEESPKADFNLMHLGTPMYLAGL